MMTTRILAILGILAAVSYIIGAILPTKVVMSIVSLLLIAFVGYIAYLFFARVIEPTPDNIIGAALAILLLATAPIWLFSAELMFTLIKFLILPLFIVLVLTGFVFKELVREQKMVGFAILFILGLSILSLLVGFPMIYHPAAILELIGILLAGILMLYGAVLQLRL